MSIERNSRRRFLQTSGGLLLASSVAPLGSAYAAGACAGRVIVGTWGGDYQRLLQQHIDPLVAKSGLRVSYDVSSALQRQTKMRAEINARRSTLDVSLLRGNDMFEMNQAGATAPIDAAKIAAYDTIIPAFRRSYAVPHLFSALLIVCNVEKTRTRPDSFAALLDPAYKGRIGVVDDQYDYLTIAGAIASGSNPKDLAAGQKYLRALRQNAPKVYPSVDALAAALKSGEITVTVTWKARTLQWKKAGLAIEAVYPKEGALPATFEAGIATGSKAKDCAYPYLNALLEPGAQAAFAEAMGYAPTTTNAKLPAALQQAVGFTKPELDKLVEIDFALLAKHKNDMLDFWNKEFRAGL